MIVRHIWSFGQKFVLTKYIIWAQNYVSHSRFNYSSSGVCHREDLTFGLEIVWVIKYD